MVVEWEQEWNRDRPDDNEACLAKWILRGRQPYIPNHLFYRLVGNRNLRVCAFTYTTPEHLSVLYDRVMVKHMPRVSVDIKDFLPHEIARAKAIAKTNLGAVLCVLGAMTMVLSDKCRCMFALCLPYHHSLTWTAALLARYKAQERICILNIHGEYSPDIERVALTYRGIATISLHRSWSGGLISCKDKKVFHHHTGTITERWLMNDAWPQLTQHVLDYQPKLLIVSLGFGTARNDPCQYGSIRPKTFELLGQKIASLAGSVCHGRILTVLEGGYTVSDTSTSPLQNALQAYLTGFCGTHITS